MCVCVWWVAHLEIKEILSLAPSLGTEDAAAPPTPRIQYTHYPIRAPGSSPIPHRGVVSVCPTIKSLRRLQPEAAAGGLHHSTAGGWGFQTTFVGGGGCFCPPVLGITEYKTHSIVGTYLMSTPSTRYALFIYFFSCLIWYSHTLSALYFVTCHLKEVNPPPFRISIIYRWREGNSLYWFSDRRYVGQSK